MTPAAQNGHIPGPVATAEKPTRGRLPFTCGSLLAACIVGLLGWIAAPKLGYVMMSKSQYAPAVLPLFIAAVSLTALGYIYLLVFERPGGFSVAALGLAAFLAGSVVVLTAMGQLPERRLDVAGLFTLLFCAVAMSVSLVESRREAAAEPWRDSLLFVDLPAFAVISFVIAFRWFCYETVDLRFLEQMSRILPVHPGAGVLRVAESGEARLWYDVIRDVHAALRENFWTGFSTGVVAVQLIVSQCVGVYLRLKRTSRGVA